jgi:hypothetical protein
VCGAPAGGVSGRRAGSAARHRSAGGAPGASWKCTCSSARAAVDGADRRAQAQQPAPWRCGHLLLAPRSADVARHGDGDGPVGGHRVRQSVAGSAARAGQRFRDGAADVVVGTDAIAMGLNMPIARGDDHQRQVQRLRRGRDPGRAGAPDRRPGRALRRARGRPGGRLRQRDAQRDALAAARKAGAAEDHRLCRGADARTLAPHLVGDARACAGQAAQALRPQHRRAGRLLLSAHHRGPVRARGLARYAGTDGGGKVRAVAGADLVQGAVAAERVGSWAKRWRTSKSPTSSRADSRCTT